jgi:DNA-binding HxlR family transcriptional regulator
MSPKSACPVLAVFNFLSKRWTLLILKALGSGKETFGDLKRELPGISPKILSERLSELAEHGYVDRTVIEGKPVKIRYSLTKKATSFKECLGSMEDWARAHA